MTAELTQLIVEPPPLPSQHPLLLFGLL